MSNIVTEVEAQRHKFGENRIRQSFEGSAHINVDDILLRGPMLAAHRTLADLWFETQCVTYDNMQLFPTIQDFIEQWMEKLNLNTLGRVMLTRLPPYHAIYPHIDEGPVPKMYKRYNLVVWCGFENLYFVDGQAQRMTMGQMWCVDVTKLHSVYNRSALERIHLIMDMC